LNFWIFLCLGLLIAGHLSAAQTYDFESGVPADLEVRGIGQITDQPGLVISGSKSVFADSRSDNDEWHEFLSTSASVKLEKGRLYHISFSYRIVDPGDSKARFYSVFKWAGGEYYGNFWLWNREKGATGRIDRLVIPGGDDCRFIIGIRHQAALVVDDIVIEDVTDVPIDSSLRVKSSKAYDLDAMRQQLNQLRYKQGISDLVRDFAVILCDEGAGAKAYNNRKRIVVDFNPDFVDWNPIGPLAKEFGIRSSRGGPEYQEFYKMEGKEIWEARFERFVGSGFALSLDGTLIQDETWGEGGYFTCHNGENWHQYFKSKIEEVASKTTAICQDNIAAAPWLKGWGCFCDACMKKFRRYLHSRYTDEELKKMGVSDLTTFSARDYFLSHGRWGFKAVEDPIVREYIKFQHVSQLEAWADVVKSIKDVGLSQGRAIPVYGNQIGAFGMWPYAVALSQLTDVVEIEEVIGIKDRIPFQSMYYKLGRASGEDERPVWVRGPVYDDTKPNTPMLSTAFWTVHLSEALANGGFRVFSLGMNAPWTGDPNTLDFMDDPALYSLYTQFAKFIDENRALFTHRESIAQVALVYSLPSLMFRRYYPLNIDDNSAFERVQKTADMLDRNHIPFDCVVFGHPEIWDDTRVLRNLSRYKVVILPTIDAISDAQVEALKNFVRQGGKVIVCDPKAGIRDENFNLRSAPALGDLSVINAVDKLDLGLEVMREASLVAVEAPETVTVNLWKSAKGRSLDVHLLNYDVDPSKNKVNPASSVRVAVRVPSDFYFEKAIWTRPGVRKLELPFERKGDTVTFTLPSLNDYSVVSLTTEKALSEANEELRERRELDIEAVKKEATKLNLY
jgi:hypothetical protein